MDDVRQTRRLIKKSLDCALSGQDVNHIIVEQDIKRSEAARACPEYFWELYCEDKF